MRINRFYIDTVLSVDTTVGLPAETAHYVCNVLRLSQDDPVVLFNGDGNEYSGRIASIAKKRASVDVDAKLSIDAQSPLPLHLGQAVSKGDRMDIVLQKATELGVSEITPLLTERCAVKLSSERWLKKHAQWLKIIQSACEQCGRNTLPTLHQPKSLNQWLSDSTSATRLLFSPTAQRRLSQLSPPSQGFRLLIGPEGGLSEQEIYTAKEAGYAETYLGPRILRTETAAIAVVSVLQGVYGDL
ncbi:16S rRNA (uracil(1498)-N(3))-methyltransferase [Alteromonas oceanisediminis]|uniref:16S rRNA (uracil(1498)-N(3))-methyltransferase n=1 Tax=Alteromonas oceanisediminis TaxID=2836180 RepID=UPI001BDA3355|nr:16S rRNA (uracil(1498)-N(3))-methyltransferase [Alteromonas oceanisediminis]MBT0585500.1 16S rRNA (uracil(1498)-N(3))-methyltransferase [Alteromonas oceanisediminis]